MPKYVVFAGKCNGMQTFFEARGYLESLIDQDILTNHISAGEVWKEDDLNLWFYRDEKIKEALSNLKLPPRYTAFRVQVLDENRLKQLAQKFCKKYDVNYMIYET